jgi:ribosomal protein S8
MTTTDYKKIYGDDSLSCKEYKEKLSKERIGKNNPNFNNKWSDESKAKLSEKLKGRVPPNKGIPMSEEQKDKLRILAKERPPTTKGISKTDEQKKKISDGVKLYAKNNKEILKERAKKSVQTRIDNGYFKLLKKTTIEKNIKKYNDFGYIATFDEENNFYLLNCNKCNNTFTRISMTYIHEQMCNVCYPIKKVSKGELEVYEYIKSIYNKTIITSDKSVLSNGFEIDILLPEDNIGIEYCGLYWHSELNGKSRWYHRTKYDKCKQQNIRLIQIFEDEWLHKKEIVKQRLNSILQYNKPIYARKCEIKEINSSEANTFLQNTHIQGKGYGSINIGLFFNKELVSVMKFSKLSRAKGYKDIPENIYELNRFSSNTNIVGGASKMFVYFIKKYNPIKLISYSDLRWNIGNVYKILGMTEVGVTIPNYWYFKKDIRYHRYMFRKKENEPKDITEWELRKSEGWNRIWDCGHKKYEWTNKKGQD